MVKRMKSLLLFVSTGEKRCPRYCEYFVDLTGKVNQARKDLYIEYEILHLVEKYYLNLEFSPV